MTEVLEQQPKKYDIKETLEVKTFVVTLMEKLSAAKSDDGKISTAEWLSTAVQSAPSAVKAFMGANLIDEEMKDLDDSEKTELAKAGLEIMQSVLKVFAPELAKKIEG